MGALLWIGVLVFPLGVLVLLVWVFPFLEASFPNIYDYVLVWQTGIGAFIGFLGLMFVEAVRLTGDRLRAKRLHREQERAAGIAFLWEILELRQRLLVSSDNLVLAFPSLAAPQPGLQEAAGEAAAVIEALLFQRIQLPAPERIGYLATSVATLPEEARSAIVTFYERYRMAQKEIALLEPFVGEPVERAFAAAVLHSLRLAKQAADEAETEVRRVIPDRPTPALA